MSYAYILVFLMSFRKALGLKFAIHPWRAGQGGREDSFSCSRNTTVRGAVWYNMMATQTACAPPFRCGKPSSTAASRLSRPSSWQTVIWRWGVTERSMFDAVADRSFSNRR